LKYKWSSCHLTVTKIIKNRNSLLKFMFDVSHIYRWKIDIHFSPNNEQWLDCPWHSWYSGTCAIRHLRFLTSNKHLESQSISVKENKTCVFRHPVQSDTFPWPLGVSDKTGSDILYNPTHFPGPLVCQIRQVLTSCTIWHISLVPWCVR
jgi:hypothetical protein